MGIVRQVVGVIYITGILILSFDVIYYLAYGLLPPIFKDLVAPGVMFLDQIAQLLCTPIAFVVDRILDFLPGIFRQFFPMTNTDIVGARIAWVPIIALFIYTGILKAIDDFYLKKNLKDIQKQYKSD